MITALFTFIGFFGSLAAGLFALRQAKHCHGYAKDLETLKASLAEKSEIGRLVAQRRFTLSERAEDAIKRFREAEWEHGLKLRQEIKKVTDGKRPFNIKVVGDRYNVYLGLATEVMETFQVGGAQDVAAKISDALEMHRNAGLLVEETVKPGLVSEEGRLALENLSAECSELYEVVYSCLPEIGRLVGAELHGRTTGTSNR